MAKTLKERNQMECNKRARAKYDAEKTKRMTIKFIIATESDILNKLDSVENKAGYIKQLIRDDMAKENKK